MPIEIIGGAGRLLVTVALSGLLVLSRPGAVQLLGPDVAPPVVPAPVNISSPVASGPMRIGQTLSSTAGVWSDAASWTYQWYRTSGPGAVAISGATSSSYTVTAADIPEQVYCRVTASGPGGVSAPVSSNTLSSVWRPILVAAPGVLIFDGLDPYCYGGAAVGAPVAQLYTVDGLLLASQATTANMATRTSTGLLFDGADDYYLCPAWVAAYSNADATYTLCADGLSGSTGRYFWQVNQSSNTLLNRNARLAASASTSRNDHRTNSGGALLVGPATPNQAISVVWSSGDSSLWDLSAGVALYASATPTLPVYAFDQMILGSIWTRPSYWAGNLRAYSLDSSKWTSGTASTLAIWRSCAVAAGVL